MDLLARDLAGWSQALRRGETTAAALTDAALARIARHEGTLHAMSVVLADAARESAALSDRRRQAGQAIGPLDGMPLTVKDNIDIAYTPSTAGMASRTHIIATADAQVTARLRAAGAVLLGKTSMQEAALGAINDGPLHGRAYNPHKANHTPGGSSGGAGAAVAAGYGLGALGTDTLGSVRIPAAYCGVVGLKPTYGRVSTRGVVPLCFTFDHVGPLARSVRDVGLLLDILTGFDPLSPDSRQTPGRDPRSFAPDDVPSLKGMTLGRLANIDEVEVDPGIARAFAAALDVLRGLGATIRDVRVPGYDFGKARRAGLVVTEAEGAVIHADDIKHRSDKFSPTLRSMLDYGVSMKASHLVAAQRLIADIAMRARAAFAGCDAILTPHGPQTAFPFDTDVPHSQADFTAIANLLGVPALSVPMGFAPNGLPMGLHLIGGAWQEAALLRIARAYERAAGFDMRPRGLA